VDGHSIIEYPENKLCVFGGFSAKPFCKSLNYLQFYDLTDGSVKVDNSHIDVPGRAYHTATLMKGKMWVFGGVDGETRFDDFWTYEYGQGWTNLQFKKGPGVFNL